MKIVCIGGGHGLAQVLSAIKPLCSHLTAIVATTDNGGSTGRIREEQNCIALGDIRRCCVQLAGEGTQAQAVYEHRFTHGDMAGHCLGNLTLLGLIQQTQSPTEAIAAFNHLLGNKETVLPMSDLPTDLVAELNNGEKIFGECAIDALNELPSTVYLSKAVPPATGTIEAILDADLIIIGPGSIITSVMPAFLITEITEAIKKTSACRVFIENTAQESSVMQHTKIAGIDWLQKKLATKVYDLSISPSAIIEILQQGEKCKETGKHLHNINELKNVFSELLKSSFNTEKHA